MRLLVLYQARDAAADQPGYFAGFQRLVAEGILSAHRAIPYVALSEERGWNQVWRHVSDLARDMAADAIFLQFFHHSSIPDSTEALRKLRSLPGQPLICITLGDAFGRFARRLPPSFRTASAQSDVSFLTSMGYLGRQLARGGSRNLVLMPHGCCQVRFAAAPQPDPEPEFDVVFVGSRIRSRNPFSQFYRAARRRADLVDAFTRRYGKRFGLFGKGWEGYPAWQGAIDFAAQHEAYRRSAVALGGMPNAAYDYYTSDRVFIAVASGIPFVDYWVPGVERILEPERDWWLARSPRELLRQCDRLLEMPAADRLRAGNAARARVLAHHTQYHRCAAMIEILRALREARRTGRGMPEPALGFLSAPATGYPAPPAAILAWSG